MALEEKTKLALDVIFNTKSLVVAGVSPKRNIGAMYWQALKDYGYTGDLYAVGLEGGEIKGEKIYKSINELPDNLDLVICAIPKKATLKLVEDCGRKGIKGVHFFTAGFGEIEDTIGEDLQQELLQIARKYGTRLIGPNCIGVHSPVSRVTSAGDISATVGNVAYIAQSGGQCMMGIREANRRGIYFTMAISYGNAADINECDLIEYYTDDPKTEIITIYIEGTRDGPRLIRALNEATRKKPVIVWKGGSTEGGAKATLSHTSSIAGSGVVWDNLLRQTGVIRVNNLQEMYDVVTVLQRCTVPKSLNTLVMGQGGGASVQVTDEACRAGLKLPQLPDSMRKKLFEIMGSDTGFMFKNPLDVNLSQKDPSAYNAIANWEEIDVIIMHSNPNQVPFYTRESAITGEIDTTTRYKGLTSRTVVNVIQFNTVEPDDGMRDKCLNSMVESGLAVFPSALRAATAVVRVYEYYQWLDKHK